MLKKIYILSGLSLATGLAAQGTFVVDQLGGAGSSYTSIQTAVTSVPDGSTLLVRAGTYGPVDIYDKSLTILCDPGVVVNAPSSTNTPYLYVRTLGASRRVHVRGLAPSIFGNDSLKVSISPGLVTIDGAGLALGRLSVFHADHLVVRDATFAPTGYEEDAASIDGGNVVFERCVLRGSNGYTDPWFPAKGLSLRGVTPNTVQLVDTSVYGGDGYVASGSGGTYTMSGAPAISLGAQYAPGDVRILGDSGSQIRSGLLQSPPTFSGSGTVRRTAGVVFSPAATVPVTDMPRLSTTGGGLGGTIDVTRSGPLGDVYVVAVSLPTLSSVLPGVADAVWLDGASLFVEAAGVATQASITVQKAVPNVAALRGFVMTWQAADLDATGLVALSNPSVVVVH